MKNDFSGIICILFFFISSVDEFSKFCSKLQVYPLNRYFIPQKNNGVESFFLRAAETNISLVSRVFLVRKWKNNHGMFQLLPSR